MQIPSEDHFLSKKDAAAFLGISTRTLDRRTAEGVGPARVKHGAKVVFFTSSLIAWLRHYEVQPVRASSFPSQGPTADARPSGRARGGRGSGGGGICNTPLHEYTDEGNPQ